MDALRDGKPVEVLEDWCGLRSIHVWVSRRGSRVLNVLEFIDCFGWKTLEAIGESGGDSLGTPASSRCPKTCR